LFGLSARSFVPAHISKSRSRAAPVNTARSAPAKPAWCWQGRARRDAGV